MPYIIYVIIDKLIKASYVLQSINLYQPQLTMKFATALLACLTAAASAQRVLIGSPPDQANLSAGQNTTIQIVLPVGHIATFEPAAYS